MTVGSDHHGDLDTLRTKSGDAPSPFSFDQGSPFQPEAKFGEELNSGIDVLHHDADVVHTIDCHAVSLASNARGERQPTGTEPGTAKKPALWAVRSSALFGQSWAVGGCMCTGPRSFLTLAWLIPWTVSLQPYGEPRDEEGR